jgi:signal transduction histidine kinase/CheY-like chemotaxis protein
MPLRPVRRLFGLVLALLCIATSAAAEPDQVLELREARFERGNAAAGEAVRLPDTWALRGLLPRGEGRYRLSVDLAQAPAQMWALRIDRISSMHTVFVNDRLVHVGRDLEPYTGHPIAQLIDLPPQMLRVGTNEIRIEVDYRNRGGLAPVLIGPQHRVRAEHVRHIALTETLPESLNIAGAAFGLFMLAIWVRRRSEVAIGWFGALCMLVSVRNYCYFVVDGMTVSAGLSNWLYYIAQLGSTLLFGRFALALSGRQWLWFDRALKVTAIVLPPCSLIAIGAAQQGLRALTYPLLIALALPSLWLVFSYARQVRQYGLLVLLSGLAMVLVGGLHDYLYQQGYLSVLGGYWMPYATPLALVSFALVLVNRLVQALSDVEGLNASLERRVAERTHELEIANAAKTRFLAAASHDMRQPVVTIGLLIGLLREQLVAAPLRAMVDRLHEAAASMESLLKGLMDLSRLESGTITPRLQPVALAPLFEAIDLHEQPAAAARNLKLRYRRTPLAVQSDPVLLEQIVRNLVGNAVRYTDRGGVLIGARLRRPGHVLLQVWDSGRGIAPESQAAVFEEFVQLDNPGRDRSKGLGLGLAIVQRSVRLLGLRLTLRSEPGRGSCFTLELPLVPHGAPAAAAPVALTLPLRGTLVWLIEDDAAVREAMSARLRHWGARVLPLASRAELQQRLEDHAPLPTLIVSDQRLPDGTGIDCVNLIRVRAGRTVAAVIVTGDTAPADLALLARAGLPVLHKPFSAAALLELLQDALNDDTDSADLSGAVEAI